MLEKENRTKRPLDCKIQKCFLFLFFLSPLAWKHVTRCACLEFRMPTVPLHTWPFLMHFGESKVIFDSIAFLLILFLSVVFIQVLKNRIPLKKCQFSTVYIYTQQVTYKTVLQYHVTEYITQYCGHIIQNLRCQSTRYTWLKIYGIFLDWSSIKDEVVEMEGTLVAERLFSWWLPNLTTIISRSPANSDADYLKCIVYL